MKNIHVLPTDKPSRLFKDYGKLGIGGYATTREGLSVINQHIYITSDEEIKVGDYRYSLLQNNFELVSEFSLKVNKEYWKLNNQIHKKIILTIDQDLIEDGVQAIDDDFLEWFVKNPSCESIEVVKEGYKNNGMIDESTSYRYKIIIPKEERKTSEEWQKQFPNSKVLDPDGWDRKNYQYSWFEEKITLAEYTTRLSRSTVYGIIPKEEQKKHIIDMMKKDEELGLYEYTGECKGNDGNGCFMDSSGHDCGCYTRSIKQETEHLLSTKAKEEIKLEDIFNDEKRQGVKELIDKHNQRLEKYSERFDNDKSAIGNPDTWGKRVVDKHKQDDENYLDSFGVTKTQFEVYRNFNKQKTLEGLADKWVFETNGHKWSNNNNEAGDNFGSFIAGFKEAEKTLYSEEEVLELLLKSKIETSNLYYEDIKEWFELNKKK